MKMNFQLIQKLLKLLNNKFSVSNDETRHYLSGIYFHNLKLMKKIISQQWQLIVIECLFQN